MQLGTDPQSHNCALCHARGMVEGVIVRNHRSDPIVSLNKHLSGTLEKDSVKGVFEELQTPMLKSIPGNRREEEGEQHISWS